MNMLKTVLLLFLCLCSRALFAQSSGDVVQPGKLVYEQNCLACHQSDGSGVPNLSPPLIEGTFVSGEKKRLIEIVLNGLQGVEIKGESYASPMPAFDYLTDADIANVLTYVRSNFKNKGDRITEDEVKAARGKK